MGTHTFMLQLTYYVIIVVLVSHVTAQFQNIFESMMGKPEQKQTGNGSSCQNNAVSCLPWCTRSTDTNGCLSCSCTSGINPMSGMNPMSGFNPMVGLNPMANMYSGLSGGQSPMTNGGPRQGISCGAIPRTCPYPQPWCQRVADNNGCVKCLCGNEIAEFMQKFNGQIGDISSTTSPDTTATRTRTSTSVSSATTSSAMVSSPSGGMSCLASFSCTKICNSGFKTDFNNCPVCECMNGDLIDTPVDATDPPGKHVTKTASTPRPIVTDHLTTCPGIFDCTLPCVNGYKSDSLGCPVCECLKS